MQALNALNPQNNATDKAPEEPQNGASQPQSQAQKEPPPALKAEEKAAKQTADNNVLASVIERHEALSNRIRSSARK